MRLSILLLIFLVLFNGFGGLLQTYDIDDHVGINAETGDAKELDEATDSAQDISTGESTGQTLLGYYNNLINTFKDMILGLQPGVQMLVNVAPPGIVESLIIWLAGILPILIAVDLLYFGRGGGL